MQKSELLAAVIATIEKELAAATQAAVESAEEATDEESRPENKYDTRGLEASYVASAQAHYALDLKEALQAYRNFVPPDSNPANPIALGSIVTTLGPAGRETFFLGPARGGLEIQSPNGTITILTPKSPLGSQLLGQRLGGQASQRKILRVE